MPTVQIATRIDDEQCRQFQENAKRLGTTPADALRMFVAAFNDARGFPYAVRLGAVEPFTSEEDATDYASRAAHRTINASW